MHQIRYFVATISTLNFTRAAKMCNVTQPALTRAIQKLEEELGGPLFRREGRNTHLTELGRVVRPRLEQALALTRVAREEALDFFNMVNAKLDLGCMCTIAPDSVISLVESFTKNAQELRLIIHEGPGRELVEKLMDGELDVAILALPEMQDELEALPLFEENYVITFPKDHRFRNFDSVAVADLEGERYLRRINCEYLDGFHKSSETFDVTMDVRFESENENWIQAMVLADLGCAIMPQSLVRHPELHQRPLVSPSASRTISVVTRRGRRHSPQVDYFINLCKSFDWDRTD
ncbi:MAG: LysR family hydrogen peroxide-inducible transcriptional activator [Paracoccaceae bacterium]|jgi:DNA-binding transcriptional LysR family regulator